MNGKYRFEVKILVQDYLPAEIIPKEAFYTIEYLHLKSLTEFVKKFKRKVLNILPVCINHVAIHCIQLKINLIHLPM